MARYQVMFWKHIPSQVKAWDVGGPEVKRMLPDRFQAAIDAYAMRDGSTDMDSYLDGWRWAAEAERPGSPEAVVDALVVEFDAAYSRARLMTPEPQDR